MSLFKEFIMPKEKVKKEKKKPTAEENMAERVRRAAEKNGN